MPRIRTIMPEFFKHEVLAEHSPAERLAFIGLWTLADVAGRLEDRPRRIKAELFPYEDLDMEEILIDLANAGFIRRYLVDGAHLIQIDGFTRHQRITGKEAQTPTRYPDPPTWESKGDHSGSNREASEPQPGAQEGNEEGNGKGTDADVIVTVPLVNGDLFRLTRGMAQDYSKLYPSIDIEKEFRVISGRRTARPMNSPEHVRSYVNICLSNAYKDAAPPQPAKRTSNEKRHIPSTALPDELDEHAGRNLWRGVLERVRANVPDHSFEMWFKPLRATGLCQSTRKLYVHAPSAEFLNLGDRFPGALKPALAHLEIQSLELFHDVELPNAG